ncbi:radical SAM protein [Nostoc sp. FACHB-152]|uniref:radical SAM protein n=1 Tax=unclassified Nostoc TaxID=2593658 RepID=UPI001689B718|nr:MULTISPECIES: radical SAM protein [unclassified Nostoc]MBD2446897.1 radical SAM protein [Nostoc sp. FACHB-152]MBD2467766.1 radical SAM protein [Nostoc sp. FACHB-145]
MYIYQVEISNFCNLTCSYCPHPSQSRAKGNMTFSTFVDVVELAIECGQKDLFLNNFGEPLIHPELFDFIAYAQTKGIECKFITNGILLDEEKARRLAQLGVRDIYLSEHLVGQKERIQEMFKEKSIPLSIVYTYNPHQQEKHDWAGQVTSNTTSRRSLTMTLDKYKPCIFETKKRVVVLWDGSINTCCIDVNGTGIVGTVKDYLGRTDEYEFQQIPLCSTCDLMRDEE